MKRIWKSVFVMLSLISFNSHSAEPTCHVASDGKPYCKYGGKVKRLYVNNRNVILVYFDKPISSGDVVNETGFNISKYGAAAYNVSDNPEFAKMLYSTLLAAQASGREVSLQMRGNTSGYLSIDRIWLAE